MSTNGRRKNDKKIGGSGGGRIRTESGRTPIQDSRLLGQAIRQGWLHGIRWPTEATKEEIDTIEQQRGLTMKEWAAKAVMSGVSSGDARIEQIAVKSIIAMEAQNQADEHKATPSLHQHAHVHLPDVPAEKLSRIVEAADELERITGEDLMEEG